MGKPRIYTIDIRNPCTVCNDARWKSDGDAMCGMGVLLKSYPIEAVTTTEARAAAMLHFQMDQPKFTGPVSVDGVLRIVGTP